MASKSKKTKRIRARKKKPNKINMKQDLARVRRNAQILRESASQEHS